MGKINLTVRDDLEKRFREEAFKRKGMKKGFLTNAIEEAMKQWIGEKVIAEPKLKAPKVKGDKIA